MVSRFPRGKGGMFSPAAVGRPPPPHQQGSHDRPAWDPRAAGAIFLGMW